MIEKLAIQITSFICTEDYNNPKDRAKIQYGINILLSEGLKIITLILIFHIINYQNYFCFSLLILMTIRPFAGGVHIKGTLNCLLLTLLLFMLTSVAAPLIPRLNIVYYLSAIAISILIVLFRAPICSIHRPIREDRKKLQYKIIAILSTAMWSFALLSLENPSYANCGFSTIILQNLQLMLIKKSK